MTYFASDDEKFINDHPEANVVFKSGFSKASMSLTQLLRTPITLQKIDYGIRNLDSFTELYKEDDIVHIIKTSLVGDFKGSCYLILEESDVDEITSVIFPNSKAGDQNDQIKKEFLTEMDNMLAAAVITEFSNTFEIDFYGGVPQMSIEPAKKLTEYLTSENEVYEAILHFKAIFNSTSLDITPHFLWMVDGVFLDYVKNLKS